MFGSKFAALSVLAVLCLAEAKLVSYTLTVERVPANPDRFPVSAIRVSGGREKIAPQIDRPFPGPTIRAQLGDELEITVHNQFESAVTSIHFHGIHCFSNPWMDGAAGITQVPIPPMTSFTYRLNVTQTGTFWYHSHSSHQYADGLLGPLILDYPDWQEDPVHAAYYYTHDHIIMLQDWFHENSEELHTHYKGGYDSFSKEIYTYKPGYPWKPHSLLLNGQGDYDCDQMNTSKSCFIADACVGGEQCIREREPIFQNCRKTPYPLKEFQCAGVHVRLRLINGANAVPFKFWIDRHNMIVVARDGIETKPTTKKYVIIPVGQRLDVIVACNRMSPAKKYKMYGTVAIGYMPNGADSPKVLNFVEGLLSYPRSEVIVKPAFEPHEDPNREEGHGETFEYGLRPLVPKISPPADERIVLQYSEVYSIMTGQPLEEWVINNITHHMPKVPILQALYLGLDIKDAVLDLGKGPMKNARKTHIISLEYGKTYEFVVVGLNPQQHPWHLHGYTLDFIESKQLNRSTDFEVLPFKDECGFPRAGPLKKEVLDSLPDWRKPAKVVTQGDTFTVPRFGYSIFRVKMDNQGPWLFHCHIGWHLGMGMAMIFSVEKNGNYPDILPPPDDFPVYIPLSYFRK